MKTSVDSDLFAGLMQRLKPDQVLLNDEARELYGQDVSGDAHPVAGVVRPHCTEDLLAVMGFARDGGWVLAPRGGGMSYSSGYVCPNERTLCLDMAAMDAVVEINAEDMYVTVEAGCTWLKLHEALKPLGLRTPFWGTLSGIKATVGGSLSQNSLFWGSGRHGSAADSVIGFEIALANGDLLRTGAGAQAEALPFFRHYGPDLTGLFTCDAGALGIKATVTLKLLPAGLGRAGASFDFKTAPPLIAAMSEVARRGLADACFAFDPVLQSQRMKRESLLSDVKVLGKVVAGQGGLVRGVREGVRVAAAGREFMQAWIFRCTSWWKRPLKPPPRFRWRKFAASAPPMTARKLKTAFPRLPAPIPLVRSTR